MGRIVVSEFVTLDGVMEDPGGAEGFARAWPERSDEAGFADKMNGMRKYVVSSTLSEPTGNNSVVVRGDLAEEAAKLKAEHRGDIRWCSRRCSGAGRSSSRAVAIR